LILRLGICTVMVLCTLLGNAQKVAVTIVAKNEKNETVLNATAQILRERDSSILAVKTLKNNVFFPLEKNNSYILRISAVGISPLLQNISIGNNDTTINVMVKTTTKNLDEVVVKTVKQLIKQEDDKMIVDAEPLAQSSTNALEILEKTPGAIIDQDGNVYLNSSSPAAIYINGREMRLSPADIASLLKSLPANSVSKIEILRNPSAKYDAASSGGIINIVLKKGIKLGLNGTVDLSHFQGVYGTETIGFNLNNSKNKFNTYLSYNFIHRTNFLILNSEQPLGSTLRVQQSYTKLPAATNSAGGGFDYAINKKWNINFDTKFTANNTRSHVNNDIDILNRTNQSIKLGRNLSVVHNSGPTYFFANTFATKYKIDSLGSDWSNTLDYTYFQSKNIQNYDNATFFPNPKNLIGNGDIDNVKNIIAFKSDLVLKTKSKYTFEVGTKLNFVISNSSAKFLSDTGTGKYINTYQTNKYKYNENIAAVYFQVGKTFKGLTIKPGVRLEYTDILGTQLIPTPQDFKIKRTDIFPYVFLRHGLGKALGFALMGNFVYRKSITRPFFEALNPVPKYADQYTYDVGNPALRPQLTDNYEVSINANEFPIFSVGLNDIKDIFTTLTNAKADTLFRTWDNLGRNKEVYFRVVAGIPPGGKYFFYLGTQMKMINYNGVYNGELFQYKRASWNVFTFHNLKVTPTFNLTMNAWAIINGVNNFFELKPFGTLNFIANKSVLKKKLNIILTLNDVLRTNKIMFNVDVPKFVGSGVNFADTRRIGIGLKYTFGLKPKPERTPAFGAPVEGGN
jgi:iron complex outermembrane recepter protein